jgi:glycosyltransferase involved in cell wall biosynthesis
MSKLNNEYKLVILGEGELFSFLKNKVVELNLDQKVFFLGFRKDVANILKACDLLVIPSLWEGFGLIAVEGLACGIPIIANKVDGLFEVLENYATFVNLGNIDDFVFAVNLITSNKISVNRKMEIINHSNKFSIENMVLNYFNLYNNLIKNYEKK